jgi:hypothetical protein
MGSVLYSFLTKSPLFDEKQVADEFRGLSEEDIKGELAAYRKHCLDNTATIEKDLPAADEPLKVFTGMTRIPVSLLTQAALYVRALVIDDPISGYAVPEKKTQRAHSQFLGFDGGLNRAGLAKAARYMKEITPFVAADYVKPIPFELLLRGDEPDGTPIFYSQDGFAGALGDLVKFFHDRARVRSLRKTGEGWVVEPDLKLCRAIAVDFGDESGRQLALYQLTQTVFRPKNDGSNRFSIARETRP